MNTSQKVALWVGIGVLVLMLVFPPWVGIQSLSRTANITNVYPLGYAPLFSPPPAGAGKQVDFGRLSIQCLAVVLVTGGMIYTLKDSKDKGEQDEREP